METNAMLAEGRYKVSLLLGSDPTTDKDAVGPYTELLYAYISTALTYGCESELYVRLVLLRPDSVREWARDLTSVFKHSDLVHIEYPFEGWGTSPMPGLYPALLKLAPLHKNTRIVTTLHEWRLMHPLRKASILPLAGSSDGILFVSRREQASFEDSLCYRSRLKKPITSTIPIGINLTLPQLRAREVLDARSRLLNWKGVKVDTLLGYFGFIYASKQPDKMLRTLKALLDRGVKTRLIIVGDFHADHVAEKIRFLQRVESLGLKSHVLFFGFLEDELTLAQVLSACNAVLLLFSDGVSARRSSFWTLLELGVPIITTRPSFEGEFDDLLPQHFLQNLSFIDPMEKPQSLAATVAQFKDFSVPQQQSELSPKWESIASKHLAFYREVLRNA